MVFQNEHWWSLSFPDLVMGTVWREVGSILTTWTRREMVQSWGSWHCLVPPVYHWEWVQRWHHIRLWYVWCWWCRERLVQSRGWWQHQCGRRMMQGHSWVWCTPHHCAAAGAWGAPQYLLALSVTPVIQVVLITHWDLLTLVPGQLNRATDIWGHRTFVATLSQQWVNCLDLVPA